MEVGGRTISRLTAGTPAVSPTAQPIPKDPGAGPGDLAGGTLTWPLARNVIRGNDESNSFGPVRNGGARNHQGWDMAAAPGTKVYALGAGKVAFTTGDEGDYGRQVCCSFQFHGRTLYAFYAHLSSVAVHDGQQVGMNTVLGASGQTGNAQGQALSEAHLHFEIRTSPEPGRGLTGRLSPLEVFGTYPLKVPVISRKPG